MTIGTLRGYPLSDFRIFERFRWAATRTTKKPEDKAYSLLGIFDVSMPVIYGAGERKAKHRLREHIDRQRRGDISEACYYLVFYLTLYLASYVRITHFAC